MMIQSSVLAIGIDPARKTICKNRPKMLQNRRGVADPHQPEDIIGLDRSLRAKKIGRSHKHSP